MTKQWCSKDDTVVDESCKDCPRIDCPEMVPAGNYEKLAAEALEEMDIPEINHLKDEILRRDCKERAEFARGMIVLARLIIDQCQRVEGYCEKLLPEGET